MGRELRAAWEGAGKGFGLGATGWLAHQCTAAPCQVASLPLRIRVPCSPQTHPTQPSAQPHGRLSLAGVDSHLPWLPHQAEPLPVYLGQIWVTWGQTGGPFSPTSVLTTYDGLVKPLIWSSTTFLPTNWRDRWIRIWLDGRVQRTTVGTSMSKWKAVTSGVKGGPLWNLIPASSAQLNQVHPQHICR